jgi:PilZ domain
VAGGVGSPEQRGTARVAVACELHLARHVGNEVAARTRDLSVHGARIVSERPLRVDEELDFDLQLTTADRRHLRGRARVLRAEHSNNYALRFEHVGADARAALVAFLDAMAN